MLKVDGIINAYYNNKERPLVRSLWDSKLLLQCFLELGKKNDMAEFLSVS